MRETLITHINWVVTISAQVCIFVYLIRFCQSKINLIKNPVFPSRWNINIVLLFLFLLLEILIIRHIPLREGYDNYHGISINIFDKLFKETVAIQLISGLNWLLGYKVLNNFILNYILSLGCGLLLAFNVYLYFRDRLASIAAFVLFIFLPPSLVLIKSISSAHVNTFMLLLALSLLSFADQTIVKKRNIDANLFFCLAFLLPVMNNVRQEFLFFLAPFFCALFFHAAKSGFLKRKKSLTIRLLLIFVLLSSVFVTYQFSLRHHNYPHRYFQIPLLFSEIKFGFLSGPMNIFLGFIALAAVCLLVLNKRYFIALALFCWLLLASNIYSIFREFPLHFYRHELYLALPYIFAIVSILHYAHLFSTKCNQHIFHILFYCSLAGIVIFSFSEMHKIQGFSRTTDIVLRFLDKEIPKLPKNRTLYMPDIEASHVKLLFLYINRLYNGHGLKNSSDNVNGVILYLPETCFFPDLSGHDKASCREFISCLGPQLASIGFKHKKNSYAHPGTEDLFVKTGFYEVSEKCHEKIR